MNLDELPFSVASQLVFNALGATTLDELVALSADQVLDARGASPRVLREIEALLVLEGCSLRDAGGAPPPIADAPSPPIAATILVERADVCIERVGTRLKVTFLGDADAGVTAKTCAEVVATIRREAPETVVLACDRASPGERWVEAIGDAPLPSVRAFVFDTSFQRPIFQQTNAIGDLGKTLAACPALTRLFATGALSLGSVSHDALEALYLVGDPLTEGVAKALAASRFPALETLALSPATEGPTDALDAFMKGARLMDAPCLTNVHLDLAEAKDIPTLLTMIPKTWRRVSFGFTSPVDEEELTEFLGEARAALPTTGSEAGIEVGLPLREQFSRTFVREAAAFSFLEDSEAWSWARCLPAVYAGW